MSVNRIQAVGAYLAGRSLVSLFALVMLFDAWVEVTAGPWSVSTYLLVAALVPGSELLAVPLLAAFDGGVVGRRRI